MRNNQEIPIFRIVNTPYMRLTGRTPYLTSANILNRSENMKNILPMSVDNSRKKIGK